MTKKKSLILIFILLIFVLLSTYLGIILTKRNNTNVIYKENAKTDSSSSMFAIMIETEAGSGKYQQSTSNGWPGEGYIFNEQMSSCENGGELSWNEELGAINLKTNTAEKCYVYFDKEVYLADYIINNVYVEDGVNGIYYHDGQGTYTNADLEAGDNSYRYAGADPNNYVCFGSDEEICPEDNLYRIIGVFDVGTKLIKATSYGNYRWESDWDTQGNTWNESTKPDIYTTLNSTYLNNLQSSWSSTIVTHDYEVGGISALNAKSNAQIAYNHEVGANQTGYVESMKIGLMYVSDYYYGASPTYWIYPGYSSSGADYRVAIGSNWLYYGSNEWTISNTSANSVDAQMVQSSGNIYTNFVDSRYETRPVFYLNPDVTYVSGDGSQENPFRIA